MINITSTHILIIDIRGWRIGLRCVNIEIIWYDKLLIISSSYTCSDPRSYRSYGYNLPWCVLKILTPSSSRVIYKEQCFSIHPCVEFCSVLPYYIIKSWIYGTKGFFLYIHIIYYYFIIITIIIFKTLPIIIILITYLSRSVSLISWQYFMIKITQLSVTNNTDFFQRIIIVGVSRSIIQTSRSLGLPLLCPLSKLCKNFFLCPWLSAYKTKWQVFLFSFLYTCFVHFNNVIIVANF